MASAGLSLEIDGRAWSAARPRLICRGQCCGPVEYIPNRGTAEEGLQALLNQAASRPARCIYVCDAASSALRPLLPHALGFVFGEGPALGHFAGVLRRQGLPACIDPGLYQGARAALLAGAAGKPGRLDCTPALVFPGEVRASYQERLAAYQRRLAEQTQALPVYDAAARSLRPAGAAADVRIGEKALVVNALKVEGLPAAPALVLANIGRDALHLAEDPAFSALLGRIFPQFGRAGGPALMLRGSLYSADGSHSAWSGTIASPAVTSLAGLAKAAAAQLERWKTIQDSAAGLEFSILIQERIPHPLRGILATGRPWDCSAEGIAAELTLDPRPGAPQSELFLEDLSAGLPGGPAAAVAGLLSKPGAACSAEQVSAAFAGLVRDGLALAELYAVPLDIEFVLTASLNWVFVQFRPLFRL